MIVGDFICRLKVFTFPTALDNVLVGMVVSSWWLKWEFAIDVKSVCRCDSFTACDIFPGK